MYLYVKTDIKGFPALNRYYHYSGPDFNSQRTVLHPSLVTRYPILLSTECSARLTKFLTGPARSTGRKVKGDWILGGG